MASSLFPLYKTAKFFANFNIFFLSVLSLAAARLSEKLLQFRESLKGFIYDQISRVFESFPIVKSLEMRGERNERKSMVVVVDDNVEKLKKSFLLC